MYLNDEWSGLADFLAEMIEKYIDQINLESLPDPDKYYLLNSMEEMYRRYMWFS